MWGAENDLRMVPTKGEKEVKQSQEKQATQLRVRVSDYKYTGGAFGRCGMHHLCEQAIREELYMRGPMVVSVEPDSRMHAYTSGVLEESRAEIEKLPKEAPSDNDK